MIPLSRRSTSRVFSCSRQALPRPARFYSTPTRRVDSPALSTSAPPATNDYPGFMPQDGAPRGHSYEEMRRFLNEDRRYTILPTPLPQTDHSDLDDHYFPETYMQDQISIIDACIRNGYDVPRAKEIFERVRK
ncbi:hypothetical protein BDY19DRAFT_892160, partial [Irpex rosettiformis]